MKPSVSSETIHASSVAIGGRAVLIGGRSGSGKSDLALRLIDRGANLISDDYTLVRRTEGQLRASAPTTITGRMEVRGIGVISLDAVADVPVCLFVDLDSPVERLPRLEEARVVAGVRLPTIGLAALEPSAPIKVEQALKLFGLTP
jgi:serine kinase of HPr protein (carbohydrate metabolism regulator)